MKQFRWIWFIVILACMAVPTSAQGQSNPPLTIREVDGSPQKINASALVFPNGTVSVVGGVVTVTIAGAGTVTNTGTLTANAVIVGNGGSDITALGSLGTSGQVLTSNGAGVAPSFQAAAGGGTVTSVSVVTANGVSGSVATATTTPAITLTLGAITPTTVNGNTFTTGTYTLTGTAAKTLTFSNSITLAGTDATVMTFPTTSATIARTDAANTFTGASTASAWVLTSPTVTTKISPTSDDGAPLGDTTHNFSDLFLATGAVLNYANGNVAVTHSSGILTMGTGELRITTPGTNAASVPTIGSTNTFTNKTITASSNVLGGVTMTLGSDADGDIYYRASNVLTRLAKGTAAQVLTMNAGATAPEWAAGGSGTTINASDTVIPFRSNSTTFVDSPLSVVTGRLISTATLTSSGVAPYLRVVTPVDTGQTANTEFPGMVFGGDASSATVTRTGADGTTYALQREYVFVKPTYAFAGATTVTQAATLAITGQPVAGSNATLTNAYGVLVTANAASGAALARFQAGAGASFTQINDNGTVVIDADVSSGSTPLTVKYNGSTILALSFGGALSNIASVSAGGGVFVGDANGARIISDTKPLQLGASQDAGLGRMAAGVVGVGTGADSSRAGWVQWAGECFVASDQTNATTTPQTSTCSITVTTGRKYSFKFIGYLSDSVAADGASIDFDGGTAAATNFRTQCTAFDTALNLSSQVTALATDIAATTFTGAGMFECHGSFEPSGTGTFIPRFFQNAHTTGTLTLFRGSHIVMFDQP